MADWIRDNAWLTWVGVATALAVAELFSLDLVLLMFALAALAAAGSVGAGAPAWAGFIVFGAISVLLLFFVRPRMVAKLHAGPTLTVGHQNLVGRTGIVDEPVSAYAGRVLIAGDLWTARPTDGTSSFDVGAEVVVTAIEGATALVAGK